MAQGRNLVKNIFQNFFASFKKVKNPVEFKGRDYLGTKYFEGPSSSGKPSRWFLPKNGDFEQKIPVEWYSWLNHKRVLPPTEEEIQQNLENTRKVTENAQTLQKNRAKNQENIKLNIEKPAFPVYQEYQMTPGESGKKD